MRKDAFQSRADHPASPARNAFAITPDDANELAILPKAILVGGAGNITLRAVRSDADVTIPAQAGQILPIRARFIRATGTSATAIIGLA